MRLIFSLILCSFVTGCDELIERKETHLGQQKSTEISLKAQSVAPETEFTIQFSPKKNGHILSAHIEGASMYMGKIPLFFEQMDENTFEALAMVGVCNQTEMVWKIVIIFQPSGSDTLISKTLNFTVNN